MHKKYRFSAMMLSVTILTVLTFVCAANAQDIKDRMRDRLPEVQALKAKGNIGENNQGYLEVRSGNGAAQQIVAAENKDRQAVYQAIAKQAKTTVQVVGQRRAMQIAEKADAGEWLQDPSGKWYQK